MSLTTGTRLGPYEIQATLGAGGMGEVYRARDLKLGRNVALKILSSRLAIDHERLVRFEREARLLATLNHPNIDVIYGIEEAGEVPALVLELVDGQPRRWNRPLRRGASQVVLALHRGGRRHRTSAAGER
jgi:serine/threonine protein kinase